MKTTIKFSAAVIIGVLIGSFDTLHIQAQSTIGAADGWFDEILITKSFRKLDPANCGFHELGPYSAEYQLETHRRRLYSSGKLLKEETYKVEKYIRCLDPGE